MSLFKKLFTEKMFFIVVGTCVCVLVVFFTLGIIEGVVIESNGETRWAAWRWASWLTSSPSTCPARTKRRPPTRFRPWSTPAPAPTCS